MRKTLLCASVVAMALAGGLVSMAGAAEVNGVSHIDAVIVYPTGADVSRMTKVKLEPGEHTILINDLPAGALPQSIRVDGHSTGGQLQIGSVDSRRVSLPRADSATIASQRRALEDNVEKLKDQKLIFQADIQAAETQKALVTQLTTMPSRPVTGNGTAPETDWAKLFALVGEKSATAQRAILEAQMKIRDVERQIAELNKTLATLAPAPEARTEVKVFVNAAAATDAELIVHYQVANAGWAPFYDARLSTGAKGQPAKLQLIRRAAIQQRSGESWDDVALVLSTTRPAAATAAPDLQMLSVDYASEAPVASAAPVAPPAPLALGAARSKSARMDAADAVQDEATDALKKQAVEDVVATLDAQGFQVLYSIPGKVSVAATGEQKRVQIGIEDLDAALLVRSVPRFDPLAYLYAKLTLPKTSGPVLPGAVSLFRDGTFVGQGRVPQLAAGEEHEMGFGADDLVKVKRIIVEDKKGESGVFTTSRAEERNYTLSVRNLHVNPVGVQLIDRIPVSMQQDIKVDATFKPQPSRKDINDRRGTVAWDLTVAPDQEQLVAFGYKVTAPAGKPMQYRELSPQQINQNGQMRF